jgi:hypothetical protein
MCSSATHPRGPMLAHKTYVEFYKMFLGGQETIGNIIVER